MNAAFPSNKSLEIMWSFASRTPKQHHRVFLRTISGRPSGLRSLHFSQRIVSRPHSYDVCHDRAINLGSIASNCRNPVALNCFSTDTPPPPLPNEGAEMMMDEQEALEAYYDIDQATLTMVESHAPSDIVQAIERSVNEKSSQAVELAFLLLEQLTGAAGTERDFYIPPDLLNRVISAWRVCWKDGGTLRTPKSVFYKLQKQQQSHIPELQPDLMAYSMIIDATKTKDKLDRPSLSEVILDYLVEAGVTNHKLRPDTTTFNSVIDAWAQSDCHDAPIRAVAILKKMNGLRVAGKIACKPDVVSYNCVIAAWAKSNDERAPRRTEDLMAEMKEFGLTPDRYSYMGALASLTKSSKGQDVDNAWNLLKQMYDLYESGDHDMNPDAQCYSAVFSACVARGKLRTAEEILTAQLEMFRSTRDRDLLPDTTCIMDLIHAWSTAGTKEAPAMADAVLQRMHDMSISLGVPSLMPQARSFNQVLHAWSQSHQPAAVQRSERILQMMNDLDKKGYAGCKPNIVSFTSFITGLGKSTETGSTERAEAFFRDVIARYESGEENCKPDVLFYSAMIDILSRSGRPDGLDRVQELYDEMKNKSENGDHEWRPSKKINLALIKMLGKSGRKHGVSQAQTIFDEMEALYRTSGDPTAMPSIDHFTALIDAWARVGNAEKAESLLRRMETCGYVQPDRVVYNIVLNAWARSANPAAPERAHAIFGAMMKRYNAGLHDLKPDNVTIGTMIVMWGRSGRRDSAWKAQSLFDKMVAEYEENGDIHCKPGRIAVTALINAWAQAGEAEKAEVILRQMDANRFEGVKPDVVCYNCVIKAWSISKVPLRAQAIYDLMMTKYKAGDIDLKPSRSTLATLMTAWGGSKSKEAAAKVQALFDEMLAAYRSGDQSMKPQVVHYNVAIDAWSKVRQPEQAERILRQMETDKVAGVEPDLIAYNQVIAAWSRSGRAIALTQAAALFDEIERKYRNGDHLMKPSIHVYTTMMSLWSRSGQRDAPKKVQAIFDDIVARYNAGESDLKPNAGMCTALIDSWAKVGQVENAERIFHSMTDKFGVKPSFRSYFKLLKAWSDSESPNAAERSQAILQMMIRQNDDGDDDVKPNALLIGKVMDLWCKKADGASNAQALLEHQYGRYKAGDRDMEPSAHQYNILMEAWCKAGEAARAGVILEDMLERSKRGEGPKPNNESFNIVLAGWTRSPLREAPMRAETLFRRWQKLALDGYEHQPDATAYRSVMQTWIVSEHRDSMSHVEALMNENASKALAGNQLVVPNIVTCRLYLKALTESTLKDKAQRVSNLMNIMRQHRIDPDQRMLQMVQLIQKNN